MASVKSDTRLVSATSTASSAADQESIGGGASGPLRSVNFCVFGDPELIFDPGFISTVIIRHIIINTDLNSQGLAGLDVLDLPEQTEPSTDVDADGPDVIIGLMGVEAAGRSS